MTNCVHPGYVKSGFGLNNGYAEGIILKITGTLFARSVDKGAETLIWLATHPDAVGYNGQYFHDLKIRRIRARGDDPELARRLWEFSEKLCKK